MSRRLPPRRAIALGVLLGAIAVAAAATALAQGSRGAGGSVSLHLRRLALSAAAGGGDRHPTSIAYAGGSRRRDNRVAGGDIVPGSQRSYLIAIRGRFTLDDVSVPSGAKAPRGTVLTLVVDARTWRVSDIGLSNRYPHLRSLGPVTIVWPGPRP